MSTVPKSRIGVVEFYEAHQPPWSAQGDAIDLTTEDLTALAAKTVAARAGYNAMRTARDAAKAATENFNNLADDLAADGAALIATIRNYAVRTANPNVYVLAQIPAPKTPSPIPAPGIAYGPAVQLQQGGALQLSWRCNNPPDASGTVYEVHRQADGGPMTHLGTTGEKKFTDATIPAGTAAVTYTIVAVRSTARGEPAQFNVQFGTPAAPAVGTGTPAVGTRVHPTVRQAA